MKLKVFKWIAAIVITVLVLLQVFVVGYFCAIFHAQPLTPGLTYVDFGFAGTHCYYYE